MAKYLRTSGISAGLDELIREAKEKLYIISPYLKLSDHIRELLNDKDREKVEVRIIFGKQELNPSEMGYLEGLKYIRLYFSKNLHAKCYLNENKMIITSMNLYEFSQQNNREMGILIDKTVEADKPVFDDAWKDIESILHNADDFAYVKAPKSVEKSIPKDNLPVKQIKETKGQQGHCIRCDKSIELNPLIPYCKDCYSIWNKYKDKEYQEKYCHICGVKGNTSMLKPSCFNCYKSNKGKLEFPIAT